MVQTIEMVPETEPPSALVTVASGASVSPALRPAGTMMVALQRAVRGARRVRLTRRIPATPSGGARLVRMVSGEIQPGVRKAVSNSTIIRLPASRPASCQQVDRSVGGDLGAQDVIVGVGSSIREHAGRHLECHHDPVVVVFGVAGLRVPLTDLDEGAADVQSRSLSVGDVVAAGREMGDRVGGQLLQLAVRGTGG